MRGALNRSASGNRQEITAPDADQYRRDYTTARFENQRDDAPGTPRSDAGNPRREGKNPVYARPAIPYNYIDGFPRPAAYFGGAESGNRPPQYLTSSGGAPTEIPRAGVSPARCRQENP